MTTRKAIALKKVAEYFVEINTFPTKTEYANDPKVPVKFPILRRYITSWGRLEAIIKTSFPNLYAQIGKNPAPKAEPAKKPIPKPKAAPAPKPATKVSSQVKKNEE